MLFPFRPPKHPKEFDVFDLEDSEPDDTINKEQRQHTRKYGEKSGERGDTMLMQGDDMKEAEIDRKLESQRNRADIKNRGSNGSYEIKSHSSRNQGNDVSDKRNSRDDRTGRNDRDERSRTSRYRSSNSHSKDERSYDSRRYRENRREYRSRDEHKDRTNNRRTEGQDKNEQGRKKRIICKYFVEDRCEFGKDCWFSHDEKLIKKEADRMKSFLETSLTRSSRH